jgi:hypothetical protein
MTGRFHTYKCRACDEILTSRQLGISSRQRRSNPRATGGDQRTLFTNERFGETDQIRRVRSRRKKAIK